MHPSLRPPPPLRPHTASGGVTRRRRRRRRADCRHIPSDILDVTVPCRFYGEASPPHPPPPPPPPPAVHKTAAARVNQTAFLLLIITHRPSFNMLSAAVIRTMWRERVCRSRICGRRDTCNISPQSDDGSSSSYDER